MQLVIVTDVFGAQPEVLLQFNQYWQNYLCVQPYDHQPPVFTDDTQAYGYFLAHGGLEAYSTKLKQILRIQRQPVILLGFSAGAAACWVNLAQEGLSIVRCVGFYGGQIRQLTQLQPLYPTELIFAEETHFSVPDLIRILADKAHLKQSFVSYPHGFMNQLSQGYSPDIAAEYFSTLTAQLNMGSDHSVNGYINTVI